MIGTLNQSGDNTYLRDDTGNRRFWPVLCRFIDQTWIRNNRTQLLAEAYDIYKNGNEDLFISNPEALEIAKQEQAERQSEDAWSHYLIDFFNRADCPGEITVDLIAEKALGIKADKLDKTSQVRIGIILRKLNIQSKRIGHNKIRTYYPIKNEKNGQKLVENNW